MAFLLAAGTYMPVCVCVCVSVRAHALKRKKRKKTKQKNTVQLGVLTCLGGRKTHEVPYKGQ